MKGLGGKSQYEDTITCLLLYQELLCIIDNQRNCKLGLTI